MYSANAMAYLASAGPNLANFCQTPAKCGQTRLNFRRIRTDLAELRPASIGFETRSNFGSNSAESEQLKPNSAVRLARAQLWPADAWSLPSDFFRPHWLASRLCLAAAQVRDLLSVSDAGDDGEVDTEVLPTVFFGHTGRLQEHEVVSVAAQGRRMQEPGASVKRNRDCPFNTPSMSVVVRQGSSFVVVLGNVRCHFSQRAHMIKFRKSWGGATHITVQHIEPCVRGCPIRPMFV